jgi:hypothetical protein
MRTDKRTDKHNEANSRNFRNYAKAPEKGRLSLTKHSNLRISDSIDEVW